MLEYSLIFSFLPQIEAGNWGFPPSRGEVYQGEGLRQNGASNSATSFNEAGFALPLVVASSQLASGSLTKGTGPCIAVELVCPWHREW